MRALREQQAHEFRMVVLAPVQPLAPGRRYLLEGMPGNATSDALLRTLAHFHAWLGVRPEWPVEDRFDVTSPRWNGAPAVDVTAATISRRYRRAKVDAVLLMPLDECALSVRVVTRRGPNHVLADTASPLVAARCREAPISFGGCSIAPSLVPGARYELEITPTDLAGNVGTPQVIELRVPRRDVRSKRGR
jgi:hypothetical protein